MSRTADTESGRADAGSGAAGAGDAGSGRDPEQALAAFEQALESLLDGDLEGLGDRGLLEHVVRVDTAITRMEAHRGDGLRRIHARRAFERDACVSVGGWLRQRTRRDPAEASRIARTARRLSWLHDTRKALESGEITHAHADQIARSATSRRRQAIIDHEATLVDLARQGAPADVARACRRIADLVDRDGSDGQCGPDPRRKLYLSPSCHGLWELQATLDTVTGERLRNLVHAFLPKDDPQLAAVDRRTPAQQRHDAFDSVLKAAEEHPHLPAVHGAPPHVLLTMDLTALAPLHTLADDYDGDRREGDPAHAPREPRLGSGARISLQQAIDLLERGKLTPVLQMGPWRPVAVGRTHRSLPGWLRPLMTAIHVHCRGPGCDRPIPWTQAAHSEQAWHEGGDTDLEKTLPLCTAHHQLVDERGWKADLDPDTAVVTWTSPDGTTILRTHPPP